MRMWEERPFDWTDDGQIHHAHLYWHHDASPDEARATMWAMVAAFADTFSFNYAFLDLFAAEWRRAGGWTYVRQDPLPLPTQAEFLDILEYRAQRLKALCTWRVDQGRRGSSPEWEWPKGWGHVHWDCGGLGLRERDATEALRATEAGIWTHKMLLGHHEALDVPWLVCNRVTDHVTNAWPDGFYRRERPLVIRSWDLPTHLSLVPDPDDCGRWDIDGVLGEYRRGRILLYERAVLRCADTLRLDVEALRQAVLLHEHGHWMLAELLRENDALPGDGVDPEIGEAFAQLLAEPADIVQTLQRYQRPIYSGHEQVRQALSTGTGTDGGKVWWARLVGSLIQLHKHATPPTFPAWLSLLAAPPS